MRRFSFAFVCIALATGITGSVRAAPSARFYQVFTAEAQGFVFYADGQTPAVEVPVRIWDFHQRKFIFETFTDEDGAFQLQKLEPGQYFVTFDTIKLELAVAELLGPINQQPHDIIVILPRVTAAMPIMQLNAILFAGAISDGALLYREDGRTRVVSP